MSIPFKDIGQLSDRKELPKEWRWVKLGEVCHLKTGGTPSKSDASNYGGDIKWLVSGDINQGEISDCIGRITTQGMANSNAGYLPPDCIMIALNGQGKTRGNVALLCVEATCNQSLVAMIPRDRGTLLPRFLLYQLQMRYQELRDLTGDSHRSGLSIGILNRLDVILPPFSEQQRIAAILKEQMAAVVKARTAAQERLRAIKALAASFLRQIFPDLGQPLPSGWRWVKLGEVCDVIGGSTPDTGNPAYWNGDIAWVTPTDLGKFSDISIFDTSRQITLSGLQNCGSQMLPVGTVIMSSRAPIGHLAIAGVSLCTNQGCKSFVPGIDVDSVFLYWTLKRAVPDIQALGSGATFAEVSKSILYQFEISLPPLPEQQRIAAILKEQMGAVEQASIAAEAELKAINTLPAALLRRAFNGEL